LAGVIGVVVVAISGAFGGLKPAHEPDLPAPSLNTVFAGKPWNITVHSVRLFGDLPPLVLHNKGDRWLTVVATVEITSDESTSLFSEAVRVKGIQGLLSEKADEVHYAATGGFTTALQPGVPERVGFFWEQAADVPIPQKAEVDLYGATYQEPAQGQNVFGWIPDGSPSAHLLLPVEDHRSQK
jgi:hypothetical protein